MYELGEKIKDLREHRGMTLRDLAEKSSIGSSTISEIETGKAQNPRMETINKIAEAFDVPIDILFQDKLPSEILGKNVTNEKMQKWDNELQNKIKLLDSIPTEFTSPAEARAYVNMHQIFGSDGLDPDKLDDEEILEFANELLKQMNLISFKYRK